MITGMGFGANTLSAFVTRAILESCELCVAMGDDPKTIDDLSGIGDLMRTAVGEGRLYQRHWKKYTLQSVQKMWRLRMQICVGWNKLCSGRLMI
jgi:NAD-dependent glycerol-3-phosphate dehydrogenase C-terminus